MCDNKSHHGQ